ncbi:MAG TPA: alanine racemase [Solirubrobacteraceae bacterium]|nr:alanine racemase [Solirubrobacteraceae bacterium]
MSIARARASVDLGAVAENCARLLRELDGSELCAVVKADGYGHGAVPCAKAALGAGATWLAVATVDEVDELRDAGVEAPVLVMGALRNREELERAIVLGADIVLWRERSVALASEAARLVSGTARVHVKLDTGMGRLGTRDPAEAARVLAAAVDTPGVRLAGVMTHFATADILDDGGFFELQLEAFAGWAGAVKAEHPDILVHAANSAAVLRDPRAHFDMVRCGIALYGLDPFGADPFARELRPALELSSYLAEVKRCAAGQSTGYGRRFVAERDTHIGVLPIGYGDGWRRGLSNNADVLVDGRRRPLVGTVSMDNVAVDLGPDPAAMRLRGAEAVLIGARGDERITVEELARRLDTINYEIACGLSARVDRAYPPRSPALS